MGGACSSSTRVETEHGVAVVGGASNGNARVDIIRPELSSRAKEQQKQKEQQEQQKEQQQHQPSPSPDLQPQQQRKSLFADVTVLAGNVLTVLSEGVKGKEVASEKTGEQGGKVVEEKMGKVEAPSPMPAYKPDRPPLDKSKTSTTDLRFMLAKGESLNDIGTLCLPTRLFSPRAIYP